jgi:hypothetical protein
VEYKQGDTTCEGLLVYDDIFKTPGVLIAHQWKDLTDYEDARRDARHAQPRRPVRRHHGKGVRADNPRTPAPSPGNTERPPLLRDRINAALDFQEERAREAKQIAAISCTAAPPCSNWPAAARTFGAVAHGGLSSPAPMTRRKSGRFLSSRRDRILPRGSDGLPEEMRDAKWTGSSWPTATLHSFRDQNAGNDNSKGVAYNKDADVRSWRE